MACQTMANEKEKEWGGGAEGELRPIHAFEVGRGAAFWERAQSIFTLLHTEMGIFPPIGFSTCT